jgi:hypothetical protein
MSFLSKYSIAGVMIAGAALAFLSTTSAASAEEIRGTCDGTVTVAANARAEMAHERNHVFTPGARDQVAVRLSPAGYLRWFCDSPTKGLVQFRDDCGAAEGRTIVQIRFRNDGGVRLTCG